MIVDRPNGIRPNCQSVYRKTHFYRCCNLAGCWVNAGDRRWSRMTADPYGTSPGHELDRLWTYRYWITYYSICRCINMENRIVILLGVVNPGTLRVYCHQGGIHSYRCHHLPS